jgi:hypothetical protein
VSSADTPADRAYIALAVERQQARIDQAAAEMAAELDRFRDDFTTRHAEQMRVHQERVRQLEADRQAWLARWLDGDPDEGRPTDVDRQTPQDASASGGPATPGPGSAC